MLDALSTYSPRDEKYIKAKNETLDNVKNFWRGGKNYWRVSKWNISTH